MFILFALLKKLTGDAQEEAELLIAVAGKDQQALGRLYDLYKRLLFSLCVSILKDRHEAEELLQEIFVQVWQKAAAYNPEKGTAYTWLVSLTRNRAIDRIRSKSWKNQQITDSDPDNKILELIPTEGSNPLHVTVAKQRSTMIQQFLNKIPDEQRSVLTAAYFEGFSQSEIADQTGLPLGTVKSRMRQGLLKLKEMLSGKEDQI